MTQFEIGDTRIQYAGVMRCCLETVAEEYRGRLVKIGDTSQCRHCHEKFRLVERPNDRPMWYPFWQLDKKEPEKKEPEKKEPEKKEPEKKEPEKKEPRNYYRCLGCGNCVDAEVERGKCEICGDQNWIAATD
jgi:hypothetical protein